MNEILLTMVGYPICKTVSSLLERAFFDLFPPFFCPISHSSCLKGIANRGAVAQTPLVYLMNLTHAIALREQYVLSAIFAMREGWFEIMDLKAE